MCLGGGGGGGGGGEEGGGGVFEGEMVDAPMHTM